MKAILASLFKQLSLTFETGAFFLAHPSLEVDSLYSSKLAQNLQQPSYLSLLNPEVSRSSGHLLINGFIFCTEQLCAKACEHCGVCADSESSRPLMESECAGVMSCSAPWTETGEQLPSVYTVYTAGR